jgi:hypothetical protein
MVTIASPARRGHGDHQQRRSRRNSGSANWIGFVLLIVIPTLVFWNIFGDLRRLTTDGRSAGVAPLLLPPPVVDDTHSVLVGVSHYRQDLLWIPGEFHPTTYRVPSQKFEAISNASSSQAIPLVVVGVLSTAHVRSARDSIRITWALNRSNVFFLVAGNWTDELQKEFVQQHDLIWVDTPERYRGITVKVLAFFAAVHKHVDSDSYYVMKTDDDSYVRLHDIEQQVAQAQHDDNGFLYWGGPCRRGPVIRESQHKWFVSTEQYSAERYPRYAVGNGYILSSNLTACVVHSNNLCEPRKRTAQNETAPIMFSGIIPNEDAYTGILVAGCQGKCERDYRFVVDQSNDPLPDNYLVQHHVKNAPDMKFLHHQSCCRKNETMPSDPFSCGPFLAFCSDRMALPDGKAMP